MRFLRILPLFVTCFVIATLLSRCGQNYAEAPEGSFTKAYEIIKKANCTECHVKTGAAWKEDKVFLDFATQKDAYKTLTSTSVTGPAVKTDCKGVKNVVASNVEKSYLAGVIDDTVPQDNFGGKKGCLPVNTHHDKLKAEQKSSIKKWISNGAKDD